MGTLKLILEHLTMLSGIHQAEFSMAHLYRLNLGGLTALLLINQHNRIPGKRDGDDA